MRPAIFAVDQAVLSFGGFLSLYFFAQTFSLGQLGEFVLLFTVIQGAVALFNGTIRYSLLHKKFVSSRMLKTHMLANYSLALFLSFVVSLAFLALNSLFVLGFFWCFFQILYSGVRLKNTVLRDPVTLLKADCAYFISLLVSINLLGYMPFQPHGAIAWLVASSLVSLCFCEFPNTLNLKLAFLLLYRFTRISRIEVANCLLPFGRMFLLNICVINFLGASDLGVLRLIQAMFGWVGSLSQLMENLNALFLPNHLRTKIFRFPLIVFVLGLMLAFAFAGALSLLIELSWVTLPYNNSLIQEMLFLQAFIGSLIFVNTLTISLGRLNRNVHWFFIYVLLDCFCILPLFLYVFVPEKVTEFMIYQVASLFVSIVLTIFGLWQNKEKISNNENSSL